MDKAAHSSRISLGTLEDHVHTFEIPIWNLKAEVQEERPRWWDSLRSTAGLRHCSNLIKESDSRLNTHFRVGHATD
jgi:hypothetical protein